MYYKNSPQLTIYNDIDSLGIYKCDASLMEGKKLFNDEMNAYALRTKKLYFDSPSQKIKEDCDKSLKIYENSIVPYLLSYDYYNLLADKNKENEKRLQ